ncbi:MAG TPA: lysophospholipid acyltransferase family protein [Stellaceae bacterium]|nr:lysophospholipid acyltransferase family protein [Stellaceae bacterium]
MSGLGDWLEGRAVRLVFNLFRVLPMGAASALGGAVARTIGPLIGVEKRARRNLDLAMPGLDEAQKRRILRRMWDNLGRVIAEYPHLADLRFGTPDSPVTIEGLEHVERAKALGRPIIFVSAHYGNWEVGGAAIIRHGMRLVQVYRAANNPMVENIIRGIREGMGAVAAPKGPAGARLLLGALKRGDSVVLLADQKMNDGIAVPFFGRDAMTAPGVAELARRFDATLIMARVQRLEGARFRLVIDPPFDIPRTGDRNADLLAVMTHVNARIEDWVREDPGQWFWLHRRWPES